MSIFYTIHDYAGAPETERVSYEDIIAYVDERSGRGPGIALYCVKVADKKGGAYVAGGKGRKGFVIRRVTA